ncbi:S8 family serine peptidase [Rheinheimera sp. UJ63]|uniref:S8 family serine peptidase n=1 Tax=Rheinheimera sp. UJ63 TaxID=2910157 RepID=UPI001F3AB93B|nr:S8 family serine peptidase [Rheinheimera sp. UJ63]MCF4010717.1 S8 family serine peptidase [Rheinheimera sp. UJ63]
MKKALLASAISIAISGSAQAGIQQLKAANGQSVHEVYGAVSASIDEQVQTPSAWYVLLNAPATTEALSGQQYNVQLAQQITAQVETLQQDITAQLSVLDADAQVLATTKNLAAGLVVQASPEALVALRANPAVVDIMPIYDSELHVADSAPYIKAKQIVDAGLATGANTRVAILDTGIDYTHSLLGGPGTAEAYSAAIAASAQSTAPAWPQGSVIGGYDFINNDPNPIDPAAEGHGTWVASAVNGIAPETSFYGYKVCAPAPVNCTGVAQLRALEAAMDPNGDGNLEDRVDIINMSLGGQFGSTQRTSGTQFLIHRAVNLGVNVVISAGNDGNIPFRVGGPSTTPNALSVGAMTNPVTSVGVFESAKIDGDDVAVVAAGFNKSFDFSFNSSTTPLVVIPGSYLACDPLAEDVDLTGKAVLLSRGTCGFVVKAKVAQDRGAAFVIIANSNPGEAPIVAGGTDDSVTVPTVMITKEIGDTIKAKLDAGEVVSYDIKSAAKSGAGATADFTSRGPSMDGLLKPEITAPGVQIQMARTGTGTGTSRANGTSFSAPITAGGVALVRELLPERNASEIKATLMNTANMDVYLTPKAINPDAKLAPISLIGAGLVDVEKAVSSPVAAWVHDTAFDTKQAALSFGLQTLDSVSSMTKTVTVKNFSSAAKTYQLSAQARYADKAATGALNWSMPASITVPAGQTVNFDVTLTIDPAKLPAFTLSNGVYYSPLMAASQLDVSEYDGAIVFNDTATSTANDLHLVYHIIPKAAAKLRLEGELVSGKAVTKVTNTGVVEVEPFASTLVAASPVNAALDPKHDIRAVTLDIDEAAFCGSGYAVYPTIHLEGGVNHLLQGNYSVDLDVNNDGVYDFTMNTLLITRFGAAYAASPGVFVSFNTRFGTLSGPFGDVIHYAGGKQVTLEACFESVGLSAMDLGRTVNARVRTSSDSYSLTATNIADSLTTTMTIAPSPAVTLSSSAEVTPTPAAAETTAADDDTVVTKLQPGESAYVMRPAGDNRSFVMISAAAEAIAVADYSAPMAAPTVTANQTFSVNENTATGTVIGTIDAESDFRSAIAEFVVLGSSSSVIKVESNGDIVVANAALLDYEAGLTSVQFEVAAMDTAGSVSSPASVTVNVVNVADAMPTLTASVTMATLASGTAAGTVVGSVTAQAKESGATISSVTTNNSLFAVQNGQLILTRSPSRDDAKTHSITITARDTAGLQATANASVTVTHKSSGAFGLFGLLLVPVLFIRRRFAKKA